MPPEQLKSYIRDDVLIEHEDRVIAYDLLHDLSYIRKGDRRPNNGQMGHAVQLVSRILASARQSLEDCPVGDTTVYGEKWGDGEFMVCISQMQQDRITNDLFVLGSIKQVTDVIDVSKNKTL